MTTIDCVILEGFKSFRNRTEVPLKNVTIFAGANSSGKSTTMQSLLLFKQTLESGFDPGPLLINGQNVVFSNTEQMFWSAPGDRREEMTLGLRLRENTDRIRYEVTVTRQKSASSPLQIVRTQMQKNDEPAVTLTPSPTEEEREFHREQAKQRIGQALMRTLGENLIVDIEIQRDRFLLLQNVVMIRPEDKSIVLRNRGFTGYDYLGPLIEKAVRGIIHVPGLRGNPRRTYPVTAVERNFPGVFSDYVASVIAFWQEHAPEKANQLSEDLSRLGLTWNVKARKISDTEVEIQVGRLPKSIKHGARDMVSIADAGFGLSQSLPIAVALLAAEPGELVYLEQPEIHLHPRAEYALAELIQRAAARGIQVVVETHSELLLLGLQEQVARGQFQNQSVILHWLQRDKNGASFINSKELDETGSWGDIPIDFASVSLTAMHNYLNAVRR